MSYDDSVSVLWLWMVLSMPQQRYWWSKAELWLLTCSSSVADPLLHYKLSRYFSIRQWYLPLLLPVSIVRVWRNVSSSNPSSKDNKSGEYIIRINHFLIVPIPICYLSYLLLIWQYLQYEIILKKVTLELCYK